MNTTFHAQLTAHVSSVAAEHGPHVVAAACMAAELVAADEWDAESHRPARPSPDLLGLHAALELGAAPDLGPERYDAACRLAETIAGTWTLIDVPLEVLLLELVARSGALR